jgi:hypothetical protein
MAWLTRESPNDTGYATGNISRETSAEKKVPVWKTGENNNP